MDTSSRIHTRATKGPKNKSYPKEVKESTVDKILRGIWEVSDAVDKVGCSRKAVQNWLEAYESNRILHDYSHRPPLVSPQRERALIDKLHENSKKGRAELKRKFNEDLQAKVNETRIEENKCPITITPRYSRDKARKHKLKSVNAEIETNAHEVAANDPRHAASFAAMLKYLHSRVPEDQFINLDKTSFDWLNADQDKAPGWISGKRPQTLKASAPKSPKVKGNCSIQVYIVASSAGFVGDVVYMVKDRDMKAGEIDVYTAPMLAIGNCAGASSHLMFVGESTPNHDEALKWVIENVVIPFGDVLRTGKTRDPKSYVSLTVDGDPRQLQVITEEHTRGILTQARFIVGKSPASCTPIFQPLDAGRLFLAAKGRFKKIMDEGTCHLRPQELADLKQIFQQHRQRHPVKVKKGGTPSTALTPHMNNILKCLPAVARSLTKIEAREIVRNSFETT
eukprot:gene28545-32239_t